MDASTSRRGFIAAAGAAALAAAAPAALADEAQGWEPEWDYEADIVAVGAGGAGLAAAVEARSLGLDIIVLESQDNVGGNSAICNGGIAIPGTPLQRENGIEDSPDLMFQDIMDHASSGGYVGINETYIRQLCDNNALLWDWLTGMGLEFQSESLFANVAMSVPREHHIRPAAVIDTLKANAEDAGAQIMTKTPATRLVQNPFTGEVVGVEAEDEWGDPIALKARRGVILCSGGYARNTDMLNKWIFAAGAETYAPFTMDAMGQDGSGILMAMKLGADTRQIDYGGMLTAQNPDGKLGDACAMYHRGAILVNFEGERFVNEQKGYATVWPDVARQTGNACWQIWDDAIAQANQSNESSYYSMDKIEATGLLIKADTLAELEQLCDIPSGALQATVEQYNSDVAATGRDSLFGREHLVSGAGELLALDTPPFYAFKTTNSICTTTGGLEQDEQNRAVDVFGEPIARLYLAGNVSGYCNFGVEPGTRFAEDSSGTGFGGAMSFGRLCANRIAELEPWE